ncbi:Helix-turn-helix domain protein [compost metagenome]
MDDHPDTHQPPPAIWRQQPCASLTPETLLTPEQAALVLGLSVKTLATWRSTGRYALPFIRCGGRIRYRRADLAAWLADRQRIGTAATVREVA